MNDVPIDPPSCAESDLLGWLLREGPRFGHMTELLTELIQRMRAAGVHVDRLSLNSPTLHPEVLALAYVWHSGEPLVKRIEVPHGTEHTDSYLSNPYKTIHDGADQIRRSLAVPDADIDYPVLIELKEDGFTDYLAMAIPYGYEKRGVITWATRRVGGFSETDIEALDRLRPAIGLIADSHANRQLTGSLMDIYLGHGTGQKVLSGQILRGGGETIRAVLLLTDMRGFTSLSDRLPLDFLIHVLNDYFETLIGPVHSHGGEVLKLIGDGMLAIFPIDERDDVTESCERALGAAELALANIRLLNRRRRREDKPDIRVGLALHIGEVSYGNVGAATRLDFTVIGPAVNLAARLEALAGSLGHDLIASADFAAACETELVSIGRHPLKGLEEPREAFVRPD